MRQVSLVLSVLAVFLTTLPSYAHTHDSCSIDIEHGIEVNKAGMRAFDEEKTLFEIDHRGRLWVEGKFVVLNAEQQKLTRAYFQEVRIAVPELIEMANDIVELTSEALHKGFGEAFGKDSGITESIDALMLTVQKSIDQSMSKRGGVYRIAAGGDQNIDNALGDKFEKEVEEIVERALGSILWTVAKSMLSEEGDFEERMEAVGDNIEQGVESNLEKIEDEIEFSAQRVCRRMATVSQLETQMRREIPQFAPYVVFR